MKLRHWLVDNKLTYAKFAAKLEAAGVKVSPFTVQKWTIGHVPRKPARDAIEKVTGGQVPPASFL